MTNLKVGVIGLGVGEYHLQAYVHAKDVGRVAICDADAERLAAVRAAYPTVAAGYTDVGEMLEREALDAVSACVPDHHHRATAESVLAARCHLLLTKPLATNLADAQAIVDAANATDVTFMVAHERRFRAGSKTIKRLIDDGYFGEIVHLRADTIQDKRQQFAKSPWFASVEAGRSALTGSGVHEVDLMRHLVGRPIVRIYAASNRIGPLAFPKDKTTSATFTFDDASIGQVTVTYEARWQEAGRIANDEFRLVGTRGMVVGDRYRGGKETEWKTLPRDPNDVQYGSYGCVEAFLASVVEGKPVPVTGEDALASLTAGILADESAARGEAMAVDIR